VVVCPVVARPVLAVPLELAERLALEVSLPRPEIPVPSEVSRWLVATRASAVRQASPEERELPEDQARQVDQV